LLPLAAVDGASITTVEGLGEPGKLSTVQAAFHEQYGVQCGFCTPGFVLATTALLERSPSPSRDEILAELGGHVCRCTGYVKIVAAVEAAARGDVASNEEPVMVAGSPAGRPSARGCRATTASATSRAAQRTSTTSAFQARSGRRLCARRIRTPASSASTPRKRSGIPGSTP